TSIAQHADMIFALVRTDPAAPKHKGISYLLIDMHSPGVTVRPLVQMTGGKGFNEVFFEDVRVPKKNIVGERNNGWQVAMTTLLFERGGGGGEGAMGEVYELAIKIALYAMELLGPYSQLEFNAPFAVDKGKWSFRMLAARGPTIYAGTNQIRHNIIGERVLGLPKG